MLSRRNFLKQSSIVSLAPVLPRVFGKTASVTEPITDERVLVVIQLDGGNDGLNTIVPFADDNYYRARKKLGLQKKDLHYLSDQLGMHQAMRAAKALYDEGRFSIIQNVGYPNPDRSHFRSMKIWQTASMDDEKHDGEGWLGRTLHSKSLGGPKNAIYVGRQETPVALWGRHSEAISISKSDDLRMALDLELKRDPTSPEESLEQFVSKQVLSAYASAQEFERQQEQAAFNPSKISYPRTRLASQLRLIAKLLKSGTKTRIFYTNQSGYDTHASQLFDHSRLLSEFSGALKSFLDDLREVDLDERVVVLTFSEFGRRIEENDSQGTDHGTAGPVFVAGSPVKGGLIGDAPGLSDLENGDLKVQTDFRSVYATILENWLNVDSKPILGEQFEKISRLI